MASWFRHSIQLWQLPEVTLGVITVFCCGGFGIRGRRVVGVLALELTRIADPALVYEVEGSNTLGDGAEWTVIWISTGEANVAGPVVVEDVPEATGRPARFLRLRVR